jgi:hypothetical protein
MILITALDIILISILEIGISLKFKQRKRIMRINANHIFASFAAIFCVTSLAIVKANPIKDQKCESCVTELSVDIDRDGRPDTVRIEKERDISVWILITMASGKSYTPFAAELEKDDKISLELRDGQGDPRCKNWAANIGCVKHYSPNNAYLTPAILVKHNRIGNFILTYNDGEPKYIPAVKKGEKPSPKKLGHTSFTVWPEIDGKHYDQRGVIKTPDNKR